MKIFLSWSGPESKAIAHALRNWLPAVLQATKPYFSPDDINKGARWSSEIAAELQSCRVGVLCVTRASLQAPWLLFEAGALAKSIDRSLVVPLLVGVEPSDLTGPLAQFQAARANKHEVRQLVGTINDQLKESSLNESVLDLVFEKWWPQLEDEIANVQGMTGTGVAQPIRTDRSLLEEMLTLLRATSMHAPVTVPPLIGTAAAAALHGLPIQNLQLSIRTVECLSAEGILTVGELVQWTEMALLKTPSIGRKALNEIKEALAEIGLKLKHEPPTSGGA